MKAFSSNPLINIAEGGEWLLAVTSFETTKSVFDITEKNNIFSISIPVYWRIFEKLERGIIDKLKDILKLRSQNVIQLHVEEVGKRGDKI